MICSVEAKVNVTHYSHYREFVSVKNSNRKCIRKSDYVMKFLMHLHWLLILLDTAS